MNTNDLKRLSRTDLLELLIEQSENVNRLQMELESAKNQLNQREIILGEAGSIAEASLQLNGIFEVAQSASKQYLDSIRMYNDYLKLVCEKREAESKQNAKRYMEEAEKKCKLLETETKHKCTEMVLKARIESQAYWDEISKKLETYYRKDPALRGLLEKELPSLK